MTAINVILIVAVVVVLLGLLMWAIRTQHHDVRRAFFARRRRAGSGGSAGDSAFVNDPWPRWRGRRREETRVPTPEQPPAADAAQAAPDDLIA